MNYCVLLTKLRIEIINNMQQVMQMHKYVMNVTYLFQ